MNWSRSWAMDRYVNLSARSIQHELKDDVYLVRGSFRFTRFGGMATIPFSSALKRGGDGLAVISVCYIDATSGMTDCSNSGLSAQSRQMMSAIVAMGLLAAISGSGSSSGFGSPAVGSAGNAPRECKRITTCTPGQYNADGITWIPESCHGYDRCY
jgi:hypothetical protein